MNVRLDSLCVCVCDRRDLLFGVEASLNIPLRGSGKKVRGEVGGGAV